MLEINNISKSFGGKAVLCCLSAAFGSGIHGISAPSGAGKTTLLRIVAGLEKPDSGTVSGAGRVSFSFQEARLIPWLGAEKNAAIAEERPGYAKEILKMSAVRKLCGGRCVLLVTHSSRTLSECDSVFTLG